MTADRATTARERALRSLERDARHYRDQAALDDDVPDVRAMWLALADQVDAYVATQRGQGRASATDVALFELAHPP